MVAKWEQRPRRKPKMPKGIGERSNREKVFQALDMKNPLKVTLSEGLIMKTLTSVASSVVGGTGFEPATSTV
jgi:hypothetical protein